MSEDEAVNNPLAPVGGGVSDEVRGVLERGAMVYLDPLAISQAMSKIVTRGETTGGHWIFGFQDKAVVVDQRTYPKDHPDEMVRNCGILEVVVGPPRPHALLLVNNEVAGESFDVESKMFQNIEREVLARQKSETRRPMFGIDILVFLPHLNLFGAYFVKGTARREGEEMLKYQGRPVILGTRKVENKKGTWWVPEVLASEPTSNPLLDHQTLERAVHAFRSAAENERESRKQLESAAPINPNLPPR